MSPGARVFAAQRYRLSTLTVPSDLLVAVVAGRKVLHASGQAITVQQRQGVMIARGTQWDDLPTAAMVGFMLNMNRLGSASLQVTYQR